MESIKRTYKLGAVSYILWGVLHIVVGIFPLIALSTSGISGMLESLQGMAGVPATVEEPLRQAAFFVAEHHFNLAAFGILAIIVAVKLNWKNHPLGFWTNLVVLGMVDFSFIFGQIIPGYIPFALGIIGPIFYVIGAGLTGIGLYRADSYHSSEHSLSAAG
ncbi:MAG: hypothetical protein K9N46_01050 [Candidatus Marinimicrobia bacterium]|nr:hypothetical protein [Candidatus Neomarinimicrobiota bacterium]MCF7827936.1 hypothetical protein [Candidatus Neomarinimicrobiota bacterium]MCF7879309.1 hypothetical protein [Candidatus Neomarinimicrobiota bacterium]